MRSRLTVEQTAEDLRSLAASLGHVDVRQRVIADQHVCGIDQRRADIAMQVEGDNQRNIRSDRIAHPVHNVSVGFPDALSHHRTMHREKHAVEAALPDTGCDRAN